MLECNKATKFIFIESHYSTNFLRENNIHIAGIKDWDDTRLVNNATRIFKAALRKEADSIIITRDIYPTAKI